MSTAHAEAMSSALSADDRKSRLLGLVHQICDKYDLKWHGQPRTQAALSILSSVCERSIAHDLSHPDQKDDSKWDPYWVAKADLATSSICTKVLECANAAGFTAGAAMESSDPFGHYDITIVRGSPCLVLRGGSTVCRLETKGSLGLPLSSQVLSRYLFGQGPLVLCRVMTGQVIVLDPAQLEEFVDFSAELLSSRAVRVLQGNHFVVPGPQCRQCGDTSCGFNERKNPETRRLVTMKEQEFQLDINLFMQRLPQVSRRAGEVVVDLIKRLPEVPEQ